MVTHFETQLSDLLVENERFVLEFMRQKYIFTAKYIIYNMLNVARLTMDYALLLVF